MINFDVFLGVLACLLVGLGYAVLLYRKKKDQYKQWWIPLFVLRLSAVALLVWLVIGPPMLTQKERLQNKTFALLVDNSRSVYESYPRYQNWLQDTLVPAYEKSLPENVVLKVLDLNGKSDFSPCNESEIGSLLYSVNEGITKKNLLGVSLVSDGIFPAPANRVMNGFEGIPFWAHFVGDSTQTNDWSVNKVMFNSVNFIGEKNEVKVYYQSKGSVEKTRLQVFLDDDLVFQKAVKPAVDKVQEATFFVQSMEKGEKQLKVILDHVVADENTFNDQQKKIIEFKSKSLKVAVVGASLGPDVGAIRRMLEFGVELEFAWLPYSKGREMESGNYDMVVVVGSGLQQQKSIAFAAERNIPVLHMLPTAEDLNSSGYIQEKVNTSLVDLAQGYGNDAFSLFSWDLTNFPQNQIQLPVGTWNAKYGWYPFLFKAINGVRTTSPIALAGMQKRQKRLVLIGAGFWTWAGEAKDINQFASMMQSACKWLTTRLKQKAITLDYPLTAYSGENLEIVAQVLDDNFNPIKGLSLDLVFGANTLPFTEHQEGYKVDLTMVDSSDFEFQVQGEVRNSKESAYGVIKWSPSIPELRDLQGRPEQLKSLVQNGFFQNKLDQQERWKEQLAQLDNEQVASPYQLALFPISNWWWLLAVALLLSCEWFVRKNLV